MTDFSNLIKSVENNGHEMFWLGGASINEVDKVEAKLGVKFPESYKSFLLLYGGGGVVEAEISGIEDNNAELDNGGTVLGDTLICREDYGLPAHLVVIFFRDDEVCWCLDVSRSNGSNECPVVSYNLFNRMIDRKMANSFDEFFTEFLEIRSK